MKMRVFVIVYIIYGYFAYFTFAQNGTNETEGLRCYYCASTGGNNKCEDFDTYKKAMEGKGNERVKKTCTPPYNKTCIMETYEILGNTVSHIRGCSDNEHFSFLSSLSYNRSAYQRLEDLKINNETACVWDGQHLVCLTKCDTNFCNGPQLKEVINSATVINLSSILMFVIVLASNIFHRK
ncbi:uncharacterized protein LOC132745661 [Ruditapes philippinarum]|uniref:uncharacterized protein LOC132745661 n=1 Tax=Ruditapes philippinarum TaxID=129788 RepID=UPI00295BB8D9|nr:uncharacterized protein LOC132745661 [Ruditapes philippinarum]